MENNNNKKSPRPWGFSSCPCPLAGALNPVVSPSPWGVKYIMVTQDTSPSGF